MRLTLPHDEQLLKRPIPESCTAAAEEEEAHGQIAVVLLLSPDGQNRSHLQAAFFNSLHHRKDLQAEISRKGDGRLCHSRGGFSNVSQNQRFVSLKPPDDHPSLTPPFSLSQKRGPEKRRTERKHL